MSDATIHTTLDFSSTSSVFGVSAETPTKPQVQLPQHRLRKGPVPKLVVNAVYAHLRAMRSLGRVSVNTADIATSLGLSQSEVKEAVRLLKDKGVKVQGR